MFASKTLVEHLLRGVLGIVAFGLAALLAATHPLVALAMVPIALVALRGCPMCWTMGLIETVRARIRKSRRAAETRPDSATVAFGRCASSLRIYR